MLVRYNIEFHDEIDNKTKIDKGITCGDSLGMAVDKVYDFYGQENVFKIAVYELEGVLIDDEIHDMLIEE